MKSVFSNFPLIAGPESVQVLQPDPFHGYLQQTRFAFAPRPDLQMHLEQCGMDGLNTGIPPDSPILLLRRYLSHAAAPFTSSLLVSDSGGETTAKSGLFQDAFSGIILTQASFRERLWHLMCFAGTDDQGRTVLLNIPKPVFGNRSISNLLMKTGSGGQDSHLVLNRETAAKYTGGFIPLEQGLEAITGMAPHGVNFLVDSFRLDHFVDLRACFCSSLLSLYFHGKNTEIQMIEVPLGDRAQKYSAVMPIEVLLGFLAAIREPYPHMEVPLIGSVSGRDINSSLTALREVLKPESLAALIQYNDKRPVMASFNAIVSQLSRELVNRVAYLPEESAKTAITNFVRHFFAVEHGLIRDALQTDSESALEKYYEALSRTEYGRFLVPLGSFGEFKAKIAREKVRSQPPIPFQFSNEVSKSDRYMAWLSRMGEKLPHHVAAVARKGIEDPLRRLQVLESRLADDCQNVLPTEHFASLQSAACDFVAIFFEQCRRLVEKIQHKVAAILEPRTASDWPTLAFWTEYWRRAEPALTSLNIRLDDQSRQIIAHKAIIPELSILGSMPFARQLFGCSKFA